MQQRLHRPIPTRLNQPPSRRTVGVHSQLAQAAIGKADYDLAAAARDRGDAGIDGIGKGAMRPGRAGIDAQDGGFQGHPDEASVVGGNTLPRTSELIGGQVEALPAVGTLVSQDGYIPPWAVLGDGPHVAEGVVTHRRDLPSGWGERSGLEHSVAPTHGTAPSAPDIAPSRRQQRSGRPLEKE